MLTDKVASSRRPESQAELEQRPALLPVPEHWIFTFEDVKPSFVRVGLQVTFKCLCVIALGRGDLEQFWADMRYPDEEMWTVRKDRISNRIATITVVAGLLLSTTAVFVTTVPPLPQLFDYTQPIPYIFLLCSFGMTLGGLIVGSGLVYIMTQCTARWFVESFMSSRTNIWFALYFISYPFVCIGSATMVGAIGITITSWTSQSKAVRVGSTFMILVPVLYGVAFLGTQIVTFVHYLKAKRSERHAASIRANVRADMTDVGGMVSDTLGIKDEPGIFKRMSSHVTTTELPVV